jgi:hypothetical protein
VAGPHAVLSGVDRVHIEQLVDGKMKNMLKLKNATLILFVLIAIGGKPAVQAQYPLLPPETNGNANFDWRPDLGGWLDKSANLVWGYQPTTFTTAVYNWDFARNVARNYPQVLADTSAERFNESQYYASLAEAEPDPLWKAAFASWSDEAYRDFVALAAAAADASKYTNWRMPSLAEYRNAYSRGLFTQGPTGFNMDFGPQDGYQPGLRAMQWTTDLLKSKKSAWVYGVNDDGQLAIGLNSGVTHLVIRNHTP